MIQSTLDRVIKSIATTTRYPIQLLTSQADLENDLGIDSVKRLEIILDLGEEFNIRLDREPKDATIRTIHDVAGWIDKVTHQNGVVTPNRIDPPAATSIPSPKIYNEVRGNPKYLDSQVALGAYADSRSSFRTESKSHSLNGNESFTGGAEFHNSPTRSPVSINNPIPTPRSPSSTTARPLKGKVALITGSGHGVGQAIARLLASRGATVIVNSFHSRDLGEKTTAEINENGNSAVHMWGSVANPQHVDEIFRQIEIRFGRLDILICNASDGRIGKFMELDYEDWDRAFRTNVVGHHQCAVRASSLMSSHGGGSIVTMSAVGAHGYIDGLGSQGVVKAAVETMTRYLACELGQYGIRVNCVVGGPVYGELLSKFHDSRATQHHWESMTPDGMLCCPMDLANAIGFLVSDESVGVNGSIWNVDHGFSASADGRPLRYSANSQLTH